MSPSAYLNPILSQSRLDEVRSKKRHIEEVSAATSKRVKTENVEHFLPGEIIDIALDS